MTMYVRAWASAAGTALPEPRTPRDRKNRRMMSDAAIWALDVTRDVVAAAGWDDALTDVGQYFGVGSATGDAEQLARMLAASEGTDGFEIGRFCTEGLRAANPLFAFQLMNNFTMCHTAIELGLGGPNSAQFSRGFGTFMALKLALESGCERVLVGGADCMCHPINRPVAASADGAAVLALGRVGTIAIEVLTDEPAAEWVLSEADVGQLGAAGPAFAWVRACEQVDAGAEAVDVDWTDDDGQRARVRFSRAAGHDASTGKRAAVITGVGVVSAFGAGLSAYQDGLRHGELPVGPIMAFDAAELETRVAAGVPGGPSAMTDDRKIGLAVDAAREACAMAGVAAGTEVWTHLGLGLEVAFMPAFDAIREGLAFDWERGEVLRSPVDGAARAVRAALDLTGPMTVNVSACAAGAMAIAEAAELVRRGDAEIVLTGGADSMINPLGIGGMTRLGAPSPDDDPAACRPFDRRRNGLVMGEGAALFVVESEESARRRGAPVLARILGSATTQDGYRVTAPRPDGARAAAAVTAAMLDAGVDDVDWVCAHGTGTPLNDPAEVAALQAAIRIDVPISSIKGATGHAMAAAGALEAAACVVALRDGFMPGTVNLEQLDPDCEGAIVRRATPAKLGVVASTSFGFGGQNCCLILGAP